MVAATKRKPNDLCHATSFPYHTRAQLAIVTPTRSGRGWPVETVSASERGIRIHFSRQLPRVEVQLRLAAPAARQLTVKGRVIYSQQISVGRWESAIEFDAPQPMLSAAQIDHPTYGQ